MPRASRVRASLNGHSTHITRAHVPNPHSLRSIMLCDRELRDGCDSCWTSTRDTVALLPSSGRGQASYSFGMPAIARHIRQSMCVRAR